MRGFLKVVAAAAFALPGRLWKDAADFGAAYHRFWFAPTTSHTTALLRVLTGGMALYSTAIWGLELEAFFGDSGFQPSSLIEPRGGPSLWFFVPDAWLRPVHYGCLAALACYTIGAGTPATKWLAFGIVASYAQRAPMATFGLDQILTFLTLYLALAPCGRVWSVDSLLFRKPGEPAPSPRNTVATRLIQVHLCVLYTAAGLAKLKGEAWWDGSAIWKTIANLEYQTADLTWLAAAEPVGHLLTHVTVAWELSFWALVWRPRLRPYVLAIGAGMHLGIGAFLGMWTFGLVMLIAYAAFIPAGVLRSSTLAATGGSAPSGRG